MLRVLHIGKSYPLIGGVETVMFDLCNGLADLGIQSDFLGAHSDISKSETIIIKSRFTIYTVKSLSKKASTFLSTDFIKMFNYLKNDYDIIHIHHPDPIAALALYFGGFKGKIVCHWHSDIVKQKLMLKFYSFLQSWMLKHSSIIIGTSPSYLAASKYLQKYASKLRLVPIGIPPVNDTIDECAAARIQSLAKGRKIVFGLGRLIYYKGFHVLIQAAQKLDSNTIVIIGGMGKLQKEYENLIRALGLEDRVFLVGRIQPKELSAFYSACDIFCMPSTERSEAFGIAQVEAMAYGKPVVATHIPGSGVDWVNLDGISGLNVPVENVDALAKKLNLLLSDKVLYEKLAKGAHQRYLENFTQKEMAQRTLEIYKELLPEKFK